MESRLPPLTATCCSTARARRRCTTAVSPPGTAGCWMRRWKLLLVQGARRRRPRGGRHADAGAVAGHRRRPADHGPVPGGRAVAAHRPPAPPPAGRPAQMLRCARLRSADAGQRRPIAAAGPPIGRQRTRAARVRIRRPANPRGHPSADRPVQGMAHTGDEQAVGGAGYASRGAGSHRPGDGGGRLARPRQKRCGGRDSRGSDRGQRDHPARQVVLHGQPRRALWDCGGTHPHPAGATRGSTWSSTRSCPAPSTPAGASTR